MSLKDHLLKLNILDKNNNINRAITRQKWFKLEYLPLIIFETDWLDSKVPLFFRIKCILQDINFNTAPKCPTCGKVITKNIDSKFKTYCDQQCSGNSLNRKNKFKESYKQNKDIIINNYKVDSSKNIKNIKNILLTKQKEDWTLFLIKHRIYLYFYTFKKYEDDTEKEIAYRILNDINERPICKCGNQIKFRQYLTDDYCAIYPESCGDINCPYHQNLRTNKIVDTKIEKYGEEFGSLVYEKAQETKLERYGDKNYINIEKRFQTCLERYGEKFYNNSSEVKEIWKNKSEDEIKDLINKREITCLEKYGVRHYTQTGLNVAGGYKWKDYILPSGKVVKIQGYENFLIDYLLTKYQEDEIILEKSKIPKIQYYKDGKLSLYFPDVYIPSTNTLYEVKSEYTYEKALEVNKLKEQACIEQGYKFKFMIYDNYGNLI